MKSKKSKSTVDRNLLNLACSRSIHACDHLRERVSPDTASDIPQPPPHAIDHPIMSGVSRPRPPVHCTSVRCWRTRELSRRARARRAMARAYRGYRSAARSPGRGRGNSRMPARARPRLGWRSALSKPRLSIYRAACAHLIAQRARVLLHLLAPNLASSSGIYTGHCRSCYRKNRSDPLRFDCGWTTSTFAFDDRIQPAFTRKSRARCRRFRHLSQRRSAGVSTRRRRRRCRAERHAYRARIRSARLNRAPDFPAALPAIIRRRNTRTFPSSRIRSIKNSASRRLRAHSTTATRRKIYWPRSTFLQQPLPPAAQRPIANPHSAVGDSHTGISRGFRDNQNSAGRALPPRCRALRVDTPEPRHHLRSQVGCF